ncbi:MAG: phosphopantothenoylcysteine decarboxylase / phosphopantothenate---cysteine ligase [Gaiellaceae bacterium]|nr:phosphopantothenoylcysteine decarboxylase / phosphopantothenate---cysteine ligase [Gaiellaceae bacterium]
MAKILVGVTGGIAAYKSCELVRLLVKAGHDVVPLVTDGADRFVRRDTFFALARREPTEDLYAHLTRADLYVIAPLTANTLAKLAHGIADNLVSEAALAHRGPLLVAPAMNPRMWASAATQANVGTLQARGVELIGPDEGEMAEGEWGVGRMSEPEEIFEACQTLLAQREQLSGKRVLVTAGGTREPLDDVRFVGNRSSGRMGVALAEEARRRGAEVTLVAANLTVPAPGGIDLVAAPSAADVEREVLSRAADADVVVMAAAVADYRPAEAVVGKRGKDGAPWTLELEPTTDVLRALGEREDGPLLVGFAAESGGGIDRARQKLTDKKVNLVVFNDVSRGDIGFDSEENEVTLIGRDGERRVEKAPKRAVAGAILDEVARLLEEAHGRGR